MATRPIVHVLKAATTHTLAPSRSFTMTHATVIPTTIFNRQRRPVNVNSADVRFFHASFTLRIPEPIQTAQHGEADRNQSAELSDLFATSPPPVDASSSAYLGEADSNDSNEVLREVAGQPRPPLDASNSAFLGESDSDDAFEAAREEAGYPLPPLDATNAAFLGEGDSDDAFEASKEMEGDRFEGMDPRISGFHGETGQFDEPSEDIWGADAPTWLAVSEAGLKSDPGVAREKVDKAADVVARRTARLQNEVDDLKTIMRDREGVERDQFRL